MSKLMVWLVLTTIITPLVTFCEKYIFSDWEFLQFLAILIVGDTILGFARAWKSKTIQSKGFAQIFMKLFAYMSVLIVTHVLTNYRVKGDPNVIFLWFDDMSYAAMIVRESISILENIAGIYPRAIPGWIMKRLKDFDTKGKIEFDENKG